MKGKLSKLEAVRGLAAVYVAVTHTFRDDVKIGNLDITILFKFGQEAVILFFFLSGFVIRYAFERSSDKTFRTYFLKRFLRIYIPLLIVFALNYLVLYFKFQHKPEISLFELIGNLLMLQDAAFLKPGVIVNSFLGNSPLWSLSYEWWFYMIFFFIFTFLKAKASIFVYLLSLLAAISYISYPFFVNRELMYLAIWWIGSDLSSLYLKGRDINFKSMLPFLGVLISICIILVLNVMINREKLGKQLGISGIGVSPILELRHFAFALVCLPAALLWKKLRWKFWNISVGLFTPVGSISFGLYIVHWFLLATADYLRFLGNRYLEFVGYVIVTILVSFLIEKVIYTHLSSFIMKRVRPVRSKKPLP